MAHVHVAIKQKTDPNRPSTICNPNPVRPVTSAETTTTSTCHLCDTTWRHMFMIHAHDKLAPSAHQQQFQHVLTREALKRIGQKEHDTEANATIQQCTEAWNTILKTRGQPEPTTLNIPLVTLATALYKWGACVCILCANPILADIQQKNTDTPKSGTGQNSHQLNHKLLTTTSPNTFSVAEVSRQMPNTSPNRQSNPQSPNPTHPTRQLRSRTSSLSNDPNTSANPQSPTSPLPTRTNSSQLRSRTSSLSSDPTTNDAPPTNSWFKYAWQKLSKAPRGSQMFHSPPLIRALRMSKSETTAHISQETWNKLHIAHMCWDD